MTASPSILVELITIVDLLTLDNHAYIIRLFYIVTLSNTKNVLLLKQRTFKEQNNS